MDNSNPFEDPDVQSSVNQTLPPPVPNQSAYEDNSWQDEDIESNPVQQSGPPSGGLYNETATQIATSVGKKVVESEIEKTKDDYNRTMQDNEPQHEAPAPPNWCEKCMNWFPLRWFAFFGGTMVTTFALLDIIFNSKITSVIGYVQYFFLFVFGLVIMFTEAPSFRLTRSGQIGIYFWARILSRMWGRAWFFLFTSLLCMGEIDQTVTFSFFAGVYLMVMALITWIVSRAAAKKYQRIYVYIAAGTEGEERDERFVKKFKELDVDQDEFLTSQDIVKLAKQAGRELANSEQHSITTFLDESCNGRVSLDDFCKQFKEYNMKQRFL